ncbi:MAG: hypothetical protein KDJ90_09155 [Nitratireductor sp.]|nr:hypothetical protein [Nitratireductor sp.]
MFARLALPLLVIGASVLMVLLQVKAVFAPLAMISIPGFWLAIGVGLWATWRHGFVPGAVLAGLIDAGFMAVFGKTSDITILLYALYAPLLPLAIAQLLILPFRRKKILGAA